MKEKIRNILSKVFEMQIDDDFSKDSTDKWDSLAHLYIIVELENTFGISFTPQEMGAIKSYQEIVDIVTKKYLK